LLNFVLVRAYIPYFVRSTIAITATAELLVVLWDVGYGTIIANGHQGLIAKSSHGTQKNRPEY